MTEKEKTENKNTMLTEQKSEKLIPGAVKSTRTPMQQRVLDILYPMFLVILFNVLILINLFWISANIYYYYVPPFNILMGVMTIVIFGLIMMNFWPFINARLHGIRYKEWQELDTGRRGWVLLSPDLKTAKITGLVRAINYDNIVKGVIYVYHGLAENVHVEYANEKAKFYQNSKEFDTIVKNNVLEKLAITKSEQLIFIICVIVTINMALTAFAIYRLMKL